MLDAMGNANLTCVFSLARSQNLMDIDCLINLKFTGVLRCTAHLLQFVVSSIARGAAQSGSTACPCGAHDGAGH